MFVMISINDSHIKEAEQLLIRGQEFDEERLIFINSTNTLDLIAVPGSGKTTALLAKLICLSRQMPFEDGSGILILSHTNNAIEEIEKKLKKLCPNLFEYPNFIGTVQSFVNKFLANKGCFEKYGTYININDDDLLRSEALKFYYSLTWSKKNEQQKLKNKLLGLVNAGQNVHIKTGCDNILDFLIRFEFNIVERKLIYKNRTITKYEGANQSYYLELENWKEGLFRLGLLNYKDSFNLGQWYLTNNPQIKKIIQKRFKTVFIDEMQDLEDYQIKILDDIFHGKDSESVIQRIGDKNQSIYNSVKEKCDWITREEQEPKKYTDLKLQNSLRLSPLNGKLVDCFVLERPQEYRVEGKFEIQGGCISPHLIIFNNEEDKKNIGVKLKAVFTEIIKEYNLHEVEKKHQNGFHIISWSTTWNSEKNDVTKLRLKDLFPEYSKETKLKKEDFDCLKKYLFHFDREKKTLESIRKSILNALIRILRIEEIYLDTDNKKYFKKSSLIEFIKLQGNEFYNQFNYELFNWCFDLFTKENYMEVFESIKKFVQSEKFIALNWNNEEDFIPKKINKSHDFINNDFDFSILNKNENNSESEYSNIDVKLSSVHSVKGQTHCATMYIESSYYNYESEKLSVKIKGTKKTPEKLLSNPLYFEKHEYRKNNDTRAKEALKMMYVGFSRPTHLLCFATLKDNVFENIDRFREAGWKVVTKLID